MATAEDICGEVQRALQVDPMVDSDDIVVGLFGDYVVLNGTVPSQTQRAEATAAAEEVHGVRAVRNLLAIALPNDYYGNDDALAQITRQALAASIAASADVHVTVRLGNVRLEGTARTSAEKAAAEDSVAGCAGVFSLTNDIEVLGGAPQL